jgi:four helix bundle protein
MFPFRELDVWRRAMRLRGDVYAVLRTWPPHADPLRRLAMDAGARVPSHLAAGSTARTTRDVALSTDAARAALAELVTHLDSARFERFHSDSDHWRIEQQLTTMARLLGPP